MCNIWDYFVINLLGYHPTHLPFFNLKKKTKICCRKFVFLFLFLAVVSLILLIIHRVEGYIILKRPPPPSKIKKKSP